MSPSIRSMMAFVQETQPIIIMIIMIIIITRDKADSNHTCH